MTTDRKNHSRHGSSYPRLTVRDLPVFEVELEREGCERERGTVLGRTLTAKGKQNIAMLSCIGSSSCSCHHPLPAAPLTKGFSVSVSLCPNSSFELSPSSA